MRLGTLLVRFLQMQVNPKYNLGTLIMPYWYAMPDVEWDKL